eukprot:SAG11_NODE_106_length_16423_cov_51.220840_27_plen_66_part_00
MEHTPASRASCNVPMEQDSSLYDARSGSSLFSRNVPPINLLCPYAARLGPLLPVIPGLALSTVSV